MKNVHSVKDNVKRMKSQARVRSVTSVVSHCVTPRAAVHQAALSVHAILQARILEWAAIPFSKARVWEKIFTETQLIKDGFI